MIADLARLAPWTDRNGRFSLLRAAVFVGVLLPALRLVWRWAAVDLGARPLAEAIHVSGDWAVRLVLLSVAITPLRHLTGQAKLVGVRRTIGVAGLAYAALHVSLWAVDLGLVPGRMATEILVRPYLTIGFVALAGLVALGVTSTDGSIRRLGAGWKRLHGLVHPILALILIHLFMQSKLDLAQGAILTGIAFAGLAVRMMIDRRMELGLRAVAIATVCALAFGAAAEAVWFVLKTGRGVWPILEANFVFVARIAPAWVAGGITLTVTLAAWAYRRWGSRGRAPRREPRDTRIETGRRMATASS